MAGQRTIAHHVQGAMRLYGTLLLGTFFIVGIILLLSSFPTTDSYYTFIQDGIRGVFKQ